MKNIQALLIGSLILNVALFAIVSVNSGRKTPATLARSVEVSAVAVPKAQEKSVDIPETVSPSAESRPSTPARTSRFSSPEANSYSVANAPASSPGAAYAVRTASPALASSSPTLSSPAPAAPLPAAGSSAPILSSPVAISVPSGTGNSITYRGQQAAITASRAATDSEPASLDASVTPFSEQSSNSSTTPTGNSTEPGAGSSMSLSFNDQLFRTKWGWEAYDQARKAASLAASAAATPSQ